MRGITIQDKRITGLSIYNEKTKKLAYKFGEVVDYREELKKYIEEHGLNQQEIVKACGLGRNSTARQYKAALAYAKEQAR